MLSDDQNALVEQNRDAVKAGVEKAPGGMFAAVVNVAKGNGVTVAVDRSLYEYESEADALARAEQMVAAVLSGADTHKVEEVTEVPKKKRTRKAKKDDDGGE